MIKVANYVFLITLLFISAKFLRSPIWNYFDSLVFLTILVAVVLIGNNVVHEGFRSVETFEEVNKEQEPSSIVGNNSPEAEVVVAPVVTQAVEKTETKATTEEPGLTISKDEIRSIIKEVVLQERGKDFLESPDYKKMDPLYYTNKGELIDRSWENQFSVLDTKHWRPYVAPPPVCIGKDKPCDACPTVMHTPYLELKHFDASRKITE